MPRCQNTVKTCVWNGTSKNQRACSTSRWLVLGQLGHTRKDLAYEQGVTERGSVGDCGSACFFSLDDGKHDGAYLSHLNTWNYCTTSDCCLLSDMCVGVLGDLSKTIFCDGNLATTFVLWPTRGLFDTLRCRSFWNPQQSASQPLSWRNCPLVSSTLGGQLCKWSHPLQCSAQAGIFELLFTLHLRRKSSRRPWQPID